MRQKLFIQQLAYHTYSSSTNPYYRHHINLAALNARIYLAKRLDRLGASSSSVRSFYQYVAESWIMSFSIPSIALLRLSFIEHITQQFATPSTPNSLLFDHKRLLVSTSMIRICTFRAVISPPCHFYFISADLTFSSQLKRLTTHASYV